MMLAPAPYGDVLFSKKLDSTVTSTEYFVCDKVTVSPPAEPNLRKLLSTLSDTCRIVMMGLHCWLATNEESDMVSFGIGTC